MLLLALFIVSILSPSTSAALHDPDPSTSLLEHILVSSWGACSFNFSTAITPCTNFVSQTGSVGANSGRTTAAQWMRVLFYDFVTANVSAGTSDIDASIGFETARAENSGSAFNGSFAFRKAWVSEGVSTEEICRTVDATSAGITTGIPAPETPLDETLEQFERAGFDKVDAIGLTVCGHTMGSLHHGGFPGVVDTSAVTPTKTNSESNFYSTRGVFDTKVLGEYLNGMGKRGGPLVTSFNWTSRSDLRLYKSDLNATIRLLFAQGSGFLDTCIDLLGRTMTTVPKGVTLGPVFEAIPITPVNMTFDFDDAGKLQLSGKIRVLAIAGSIPEQSLTIRIANHLSELAAEKETGSYVFGRSGDTYWILTYFSFSANDASI